MDNKDVIKGHIKDLSLRTYNNEYITHTNFLGLSEMSDALEAIRLGGGNTEVKSFNGVNYCIYGGCENAERNILFFLPYYINEETFMERSEYSGEIISCIEVSAINDKFADTLTHRDYLGALMNIGIERDIIGDIIVNSSDHKAYIFVMKSMAQTIVSELIRIKHTSVKCDLVPNNKCNFSVNFKEVEGSVASTRLDAVIAFVYHLSRNEVKELISKERVFVEWKAAFSGGYTLKEMSRVSVRGYGKFKFVKSQGQTRKGRIIISVQIYQ